MLPTYRDYIREKFSRATMSEDPFPHLYIRDALPPELYREMETALPAASEVRGALRRDRLRRWARRPWRLPNPDPVYFYVSAEAKAGDLDAYSAEWHRRFGDTIALVETLLHERLRVQEPWVSGQRVFFFRPTGWAIPPHVHPRSEVTNTMIYFPSRENLPEQGTLLYRPRPNVELRPSPGAEQYDSGDLEPAAIIPYLPNTLISWVNTPGAVHGSTEIAGAPARRYLYFVSSRAPH
jgi:hypothetical protein